jgi:hypothetical protein
VSSVERLSKGVWCVCDTPDLGENTDVLMENRSIWPFFCGLKIAQWLVAQGARYVALIGRRGVTTAAQRECLAK